MKTLRLWLGGGITLCVALVAAGWFLAVTPARESIATTNAQTAQLLTTNDQLRAQADQLRAEATQLGSKRTALEQVAASIPAGNDLANLERTLRAEAANTHVTWLKFSPGPPTSVAAAAPGTGSGAAIPSYQSIPVALEVVGSFASLEEYLHDIDRASRLIVLKNVTLAPGSGSGGAAASAAPGAGSQLDVPISAVVFQTDSGITTVPANLGALESQLAAQPGAVKPSAGSTS